MERQAAFLRAFGGKREEEVKRRSHLVFLFTRIQRDEERSVFMSTAQKSINSLLQTHVDLIFKWPAGKRSTAASWRGKLSMIRRHVTVGAQKKTRKPYRVIRFESIPKFISFVHKIFNSTSIFPPPATYEPNKNFITYASVLKKPRGKFALMEKFLGRTPDNGTEWPIFGSPS